MKKKVLVVNGDGFIRDALAEIVEKTGYTTSLASTGDEAMKIVINSPVDLVLSAGILRDIPSVELKKRILKRSPETTVIILNNFSVIKSSDDVLRFGVSDYIIDQAELTEFLVHSVKGRETSLSLPVTDDELKQCLISTIDILIGLLEVNDPFFGGNSHITMEYSKAVAEEMGLTRDMIDEIVIASLLHDIGKIGVKKEILYEKKELTPSQYGSIKGHCDNGVKILEAISFPWKIKPIVMHHHERYDGNGYPSGLKGREIPIGARILAVVDTFTAMTGNRPHRKAVTKEEAIRELHENVGNQFDPEVVEVFTQVVEKKFFFRGVTTRPRLLIMDDENDYLTLMKLKLINEGFDVDATDNSPDAFEFLKKEQYDMAILDVVMPSMTGLEMYREMKNSSEIEEIPVVFLSAKGDVELKVEAFQLGAEDYIVKPVEMVELSARINNIIRKDQQRKMEISGLRNPGVMGTLANLGIPDIVQTLHLGLKTAVVTLKRKGEEAKIFFENGRVKHCAYGKWEGEDAFYELLRWPDGEFVIEHGIKTTLHSVSMDEMQMLMEGLRRLDESRKEDVSEKRL